LVRKREMEKSTVPLLHLSPKAKEKRNPVSGELVKRGKACGVRSLCGLGGETSRQKKREGGDPYRTQHGWNLLGVVGGLWGKGHCGGATPYRRGTIINDGNDTEHKVKTIKFTISLIKKLNFPYSTTADVFKGVGGARCE